MMSPRTSKGVPGDGIFKIREAADSVLTKTKKRWYRSVRKQFWFKGNLEDAVTGNIE